MNWIEVADGIDDGQFDDGLDELARAIAGRRDVVARRRARRLVRELAVKDRVMLTNGIKPRYLEGVTGVIKSIKDGAAIVRLNEIPSHRGRPSLAGPKKNVLVPFIHLQKLDDDVDSLSDIDEEEYIGDDQDEDDEDDDD